MTERGGVSQGFRELLGVDVAREHSLNLEDLNISQVDLSDLDIPFMEEEVWAVIKDMPADRAPGPDGFIGVFFQNDLRQESP